MAYTGPLARSPRPGEENGELRLPSKKTSRAQARLRVRRDLSRLKRAGLISPKTNVRKRATASQLRAIEKYKDVLRHKSVPVKVSAKDARFYRKNKFKTRGRTVVVSRKRGERVRVSKEGIISFRNPKSRETRLLHVKGKLPKRKKGMKRFYAVPFANGGTVRFESMAELKAFMGKKEYAGYKNWRDYLEIADVPDDDADDFENDE